MKILFISPSYKPAYCYGGPTVSVSQLAETLVQLGNEVTIYTTTANGKTELEVKENERVILNGVAVYYFKRLTGDHTHISFALWNKLNNTVDQFDIIHLQSWWSILIAGSAFICAIKKKKYIISPRGMLSAYTFQTGSSFYKKILHQLIGKRLLKNSYLHATSVLEWKELLKLSKKIKGFIAY
ncbi:MAG TPA: glycosyltransferase, partial [Flavisolibacter sp.]|nr:glycosyltransferase [Flavisolibacter sp.]